LPVGLVIVVDGTLQQQLRQSLLTETGDESQFARYSQLSVNCFASTITLLEPADH